MNPGNLPLIIALLVSAASAALLYKPMFGQKKDFWECVFYSLKPDFLSWLDKDLQRDFAKTLKLGAFLLLTVGAGICAYGAIVSFSQ